MKFNEVASNCIFSYNIINTIKQEGEYIIMTSQKKRGLKTRHTISSTIDIELHERLQALTKETKVPISKLLDEAIELLLKKRES